MTVANKRNAMKMKPLIALTVAVGISGLLAGCKDDRPIMDARWQEGGTRILTDAQSNQYAVAHITAQGYRITPLSK